MSSKPESSREKVLVLVIALGVIAGAVYWYMMWYLIFKAVAMVVLVKLVKLAVGELKRTDRSSGSHGSVSFGTRTITLGLWLLPCLAVVGALHGFHYDLTHRGAIFTSIELMLVAVASTGWALINTPDRLHRKLFEKSPERR